MIRWLARTKDTGVYGRQGGRGTNISAGRASTCPDGHYGASQYLRPDICSSRAYMQAHPRLRLAAKRLSGWHNVGSEEVKASDH